MAATNQKNIKYILYRRLIFWASYYREKEKEIDREREGGGGERESPTNSAFKTSPQI